MELSKYNPNEEGIWEVRGADTNFDLGGSHELPFLGFYEGKYQDVADHARDLHGFYGMNHVSGRIEKIKVHKIDSETLKRKAELTEKKAELEVSLRAVENELAEL